MNHATASDDLLLDLYACPAEPARWPVVLDRLCAETGARSAVVQAYSFDGARARVHWTAQDTRTGAQQAVYATRISDEGNPRLDMRRAWRGLNRIARDEDLFEPGDDAGLKLQQQLATLGLGRFVGSLQQLRNDTYLGLALHRAVDDRGDFSAEQVQRLSALAPHVGQAFELGGRLQTAAWLDARLQRHFDRLRCGLIICDGRAQVQWMNRSADRLLASNGTLCLLAGTLRTRGSAGPDALLHEIVDLVAAKDTAGRYIALGQGPRKLHVAIQPMASAEAPSCGGTSVLLVLTGAADCGGIPPAALAKLFGLTPAEASLVSAIVTGSTLEQYSQHRGVSVGTARGQLKQALAKTGAARQSELVRLVLSSAAAQLLAHAGDVQA